MTISEAQQEYNKLLKRFYKANEYFERTDITQQEKEKFLDNYIKILNRLSELLLSIGIYDNEQVLEGFHD